MHRPQKPILTLVLAALLLVSPLFAQSPIDSLKREAQLAPTDSLRLQFLFQVGVRYYYQTLADSAMSYFKRVLSDPAIDTQGFWQARGHQGMGLVLTDRGDYPAAIQHTFQAVEYYEKHNLKKYVAQGYGNIASLYFHLADYETSLAYNQQSAALNQELGELYGVAASYNNLFVIYDEWDSIAAAGAALAQARAAILQLKDTASFPLMYNNLGTLYRKRQQADSALYALRLARSYARQLNQTGVFDLIYANLGSTWGALGQYDSAFSAFDRAIDYARADLDKLREKVIYQDLARTHAAAGNYEQAYAYEHRYVALNDSLLRKSVADQLNVLNLQFETEQREKRIREQELRLSRQQNRQLLLGGIIVLMALLALGGYFVLSNRQRRQKEVARHALELQEAEAASLREMNHLKSRFFANISHEFRTPLTLIVGPLQQLISGTLSGDPGSYYRMMARNTRRLQQLINQLLDLSKLESGKLRLERNPGKFVQEVRAISGNFDSLAEMKNIHYLKHLPEQDLHADFDRDKLEKILSNLLSNAFKFTPDDGTVEVELRRIPSNETATEQILLAVRDTGIGIPAERLPNIFDRFYQVESDAWEGSGIGLALVKELVELHNGSISVSSEVGKGTAFTVCMPFQEAEPIPLTEQASAVPVDPNIESQTKTAPSIATQGAPVVMIVEDNPDVRHYLCDLLQGQYTLLTAAEGTTGLALCREQIPDLIISDVMMPGMDGNALAAALKSDERTSHIPIILLTAKAGKEHKIEGLETGADDYLTKPFDSEELLVRVANLIRQRQQFRERLGRQILKLSPEKVEVSSIDQQFMEKIMALIEQHMQDETFSIEELGKEAGLSRSQLHRKIKALTDQSPSQFLRSLRLKRAHQLLEQQAATAAEIAYLTGFSSPAYFSKCFKDEYGISPTAVMGKAPR